MRCLIALMGLAVLGLVAGLAVVELGLPDVSATTPHAGVTEWFLSTTMENAVRRRAADIAVPDDLDEAARVRAGASAYDAMCAGCHAAPGVEAGVLAEGLLPPPPELAETAGEWGDAELFWITRHGVRMTGMPAFGPTHRDGELWDVVAFLRRLPDLSPLEYRSLVDDAEEGHRHEHDPGGHRGDAAEDEH